jgi:osmotically inducible protein OsmC
VNRNASAIWRGNRPEGAGTLSTGSEVLSQAQYSARSADGVSTNPEELIAAALAGCFATALAKELSLAGLHPEQIESCVIATVDGSAAEDPISHLQLNIQAKVPGCSQDQFVVAALAAKANSPMARLLKTTISMTAHLDTN